MKTPIIKPVLKPIPTPIPIAIKVEIPTVENSDIFIVIDNPESESESESHQEQTINIPEEVVYFQLCSRDLFVCFITATSAVIVFLLMYFFLF